MALFLLCPNLGWIQGQFNFTELSLRYHYEAPAMDEPAYLIPVYIFTGEVRDGTAKTPFVRYIPACPDLREEIPAVK